MNKELAERSFGNCEICGHHSATLGYILPPRTEDKVENKIALCSTCHSHLNDTTGDYFRTSVEGSIWSVEPAVQALSFRLLKKFENENWASTVISSIDLEESVTTWALDVSDPNAVHKDAFGSTLEAGDNVVLIQALDVKGTNFTASKGTVVKRIRLIQDNIDQIEGKINDQSIVILTKYTKKQ
ncbi:MAG: PhnA domain-containing protein [Flavobacteriales bacterium]|jgi:protein PhnA